MSEKPHDLAERAIAAAPVGIGLLDADLRYLRVNPALAAIHGVAVEDHIGRAHIEVSPQTAPTVEPVLRDVLASGEPRNVVEAVADHTYVTTAFRVDHDGRRAVGRIVVDITPHLSNNLIEQFAHDLRSPLSAVDTAAALIAPDVPDGKPRQHLAVLQRATGRMKQLIADVADSDALRRGGIPLARTHERARELADAAIAQVEAAAATRSVRIECGPCTGVADCDRNRVVQALQYLIAIAVRASSRGGVVTVAAHAGGPAITFAITDGGRASGPTGLGMHVARSIVEAHGGTLRREHHATGTTVYVTLASAPRVDGA